ncbi:hypothetical protein TYRP_016084, partial [Tyrophagus putrescentiae]
LMSLLSRVTAHAFCSSARLEFARALRAKRARPEETEVNSGQVTSEIRDKRCTAQGGEVWHHLYTLNFRCLGSRERSERGPRRRKFKVYKRCRVSRRNRQNLTVHSTRRRGLALLVYFKLPLPLALLVSLAGPSSTERPSPDIAGQSLPATPLTTSWRRYTAHRNTGLRRCSIAHATLVLSTLVRSSGPQSSSASSCHPILVNKGSNYSVHVKLSLHLEQFLPRATRGQLQAARGHLQAVGAIFGLLRAIFGSHGAVSGPSPGQPVVICIMATRGHCQATHGFLPGYFLRGYSGQSSQSALGCCILSSSPGGSPKTAPKLLRSISAVTALLASQIGTSLAYWASLGVSRAIFSTQHSSCLSFFGIMPFTERSQAAGAAK